MSPNDVACCLCVVWGLGRHEKVSSAADINLLAWDTINKLIWPIQLFLAKYVIYLIR